MKKEESVFVPALKLFIICFAVALLLSALNFVTSPIIEESKRQKKIDAMSQVMENCTFTQMSENVYEAYENGELKGYAVNVVSPKGYGGDITLMVGFSTDLKVMGISFVEMSETKNIGTKTRDEAWFCEQFLGKEVLDDFEVITGATVSSRAVHYGITLAEDMVKEAISN